MSSYSERLRRERRAELASRALAFATKTEDGQAFPSSDYAYVPDPDMPSTWKLRLTSTPGGDPDPQIVGAAIAALGKGFRGNKVQIPADDLAKVKAKVKAAWKKANPDKDEKEMPSVIACGEMDHGYEGNPLGYGPIKSATDRAFLESLIPHHKEILDSIIKTDFEDPMVADYAAHLAKKLIKASAELREKLGTEELEIAAEAEPVFWQGTDKLRMEPS